MVKLKNTAKRQVLKQFYTGIDFLLYNLGHIIKI